MKIILHTVIISTAFALLPTLEGNNASSRKSQKAELVKKHLKRLKKEEGGIKLVGGREEYEGNVEILHNGRWGAICDDEWDATEAQVVCKQLGYPAGTGKPTHSSYFGQPRRNYWMDNLYCDGSEEDLHLCRFDGWGQHDCEPSEAAGVMCYEDFQDTEPAKEEPRPKIMKRLPKRLKIRLSGGRVETEGRVEVKYPRGKWEVMCGDGWSLLEAMVVCRELSLGYASDALQTPFFGGNLSRNSFSDITCRGNETALNQCIHDAASRGKCESQDVAGVYCVNKMADLVIDEKELMVTAHLEDKQMFFLQCSMEENCLASQAYKIQKESDSWHLEIRRLLRFTAKILNAGTADFRPSLPKYLWEWHMCHMHYHSMEVFATFDVYDSSGVRVAEGHKASFCLEDNQCLPGVKPRFACANYGDQGISVNCSDIYRYTVDCQWVDITDINPGVYSLKIAVNPEFKVPEISFENNAAVCQFYYTGTIGMVTNCVVERP